MAVSPWICRPPAWVSHRLNHTGVKRPFLSSSELVVEATRPVCFASAVTRLYALLSKLIATRYTSLRCLRHEGRRRGKGNAKAEREHVTGGTRGGKEVGKERDDSRQRAPASQAYRQTPAYIHEQWGECPHTYIAETLLDHSLRLNNLHRIRPARHRVGESRRLSFSRAN